MEIHSKKCKKCGREQPLSEFYKAEGCKDGHMNVCKECYIQQRKQYRQSNKERIAKYMKQYRQSNREAIFEQKKQYKKTPMGRASNLVGNYKRLDKEANRGECTLTAQWMVDNIFTKPCHWCGESDWHKLGCDRIDNDKPHTPDNVNPCCEKCNNKRGTKTYEEFLLMI